MFPIRKCVNQVQRDRINRDQYEQIGEETTTKGNFLFGNCEFQDKLLSI